MPTRGRPGGLLVAVVCAAVAIFVAPASATPAAIPAAASLPCPDAQVAPTPDTLPEARRSMLCLINLVRTRHGLALIHTSADLRSIARHYALDMMHDNFFAHRTPAGRTVADRARAAGYFRDTSDWKVGEAIAWGQATYATPLGTLFSWLTSPRHRRLLLSTRYDEMGIGVAYGSPRAAASPYQAGTYVATFGFRKLK